MKPSKIINTETDLRVGLTQDLIVLLQRGRPMTTNCKSRHSFILLSALRQVHRPFTQFDVVLSVSIYSILSFPKRHPVVFLRLLPRLPVTSNLPSICSLITCLRRQFLRQTCPIQSSFLIFTLCRIFLSPWLRVTLLYLSHGRSNWSSLAFSKTAFKNFPGISDLLFGVSKFQHHTPHAVL